MHIHRFLFLFNFYYMQSAYHFGGVLWWRVPNCTESQSSTYHNQCIRWYRNLIILYTKKKKQILIMTILF